MARWADDLAPEEATALDALLAALSRRRPSGWSVVRGLNELVLRPARREVGRFGITLGRGAVLAAFHDRRRGVWTAQHEWPASEATADAVIGWAEQVAADPDSASVQQ
jgi:hypothetical protein